MIARLAGANGFFSLKWKLMLLLSVVLLIASGTLIWRAYHDLVGRFEAQRAEIRERHLVEARAMVDESAQRLQQQADLLASMAGLAGFSGEAASMAQVRSSMDAYWASMQLNSVLDSIQLYGADGHSLATWSNSPTTSWQETGHIRPILKSEQSMNWLACREECVQHAAAPVLADGRAAGVVAVSGSLAEMILSFNRLTGLDVGLLSPNPQGRGERFLPGLGLGVAGLSGQAQHLPLLKSLAALPAPQAGHRWLTVREGDRYYDLVFGRLGDQASAPWLVLIEDVSADYARMQSQAWWQLGSAMAVSLLALGLLALLLNGPLRRLTQASKAIPLLGQGAFSQARAAIRSDRKPVFKDEIDLLDEAAVALSYRLEELESEVRTHAGKVQAMLDQVSAERDLNNSLLDTAQVIILTQNSRGEILSINDYGEALAGWSERELKGRRFSEMLCREDAMSAEIGPLIADAVDAHGQHLHCEGVLVSRDGAEHEIAWSHSRLAGGEYVLSVGLDITERKRAETRMLWLAEHDQLTGLDNRQVFQRDLEQALAVARRSGRSGALLFLDLDGFKYVNDVSGHQAGDALLRLVAEEISAVIRDTDRLARLGGDELGILLHECDQDGAVEVAEKINRRLAAVRFPGLGANHSISASVGIVIFPTGDMDVKQMLANADIAMYQAKAAGRGGWHLYAEGEGLQEKFQQWVHWEEAIKKALEKHAFVIHYQPILDTRSNAISHYEALVRMRSDDGSLIAPGQFMEVAEKSGLIREIDRYVIRTAIDRLLEMLAAGSTCKMAVNLSGVSINDDGLLDFLRQELARSPLLPQNLIFEITETAAVADFSVARTFMQAVRELGCVFSLDDFGVGFSSFYYVKHLPVDYVKIDGSFIRTLADSPDDQVFVRALAEVARGFGKKTVAEFVENDRILALLRAFGVDYAQGYFIGKPGERTDL